MFVRWPKPTACRSPPSIGSFRPVPCSPIVARASGCPVASFLSRRCGISQVEDSAAGTGSLTGIRPANIFRKDAVSSSRAVALPLRSMVGQLTLDQHIGVRIPEGQPSLAYPPAIQAKEHPPCHFPHAPGGTCSRHATRWRWSSCAPAANPAST